MKLFIPGFIVIVFLFGCMDNGTSDNAGNSNKDFKLPAKDLAIVDQNGKPRLKMNTKGEIFLQEQKLGAISIIGEIKDRDGNFIGNFKADSLVPIEKSQLPTRIDGEGNIYRAGKKFLYWNSNGKLFNDTASTGFSLLPNDSKLYQCASIIFVLYFFYSPDIPVLHNTSSRIDSTVVQFERSDPYRQALNSGSTSDEKNALLHLFDHYKEFDAYNSLNKIEKPWHANYFKVLDSINTRPFIKTHV